MEELADAVWHSVLFRTHSRHLVLQQRKQQRTERAQQKKAQGQQGSKVTDSFCLCSFCLCIVTDAARTCTGRSVYSLINSRSASTDQRSLRMTTRIEETTMTKKFECIEIFLICVNGTRQQDAAVVEQPCVFLQPLPVARH